MLECGADARLRRFHGARTGETARLRDAEILCSRGWKLSTVPKPCSNPSKENPFSALFPFEEIIRRRMAVRGGVVRTSSVAAGMLAMMILFVHVEQAEVRAVHTAT